MKKIVLLAFVSVLLSSMLVITQFVVLVKAEPKIIHVDDDNKNDPFEDGSLEHPFDKIGEGVDVANAGDIVFVHNGTYFEWSITLKDDLSLVGENRDDTVIDGMGYGWILKIINAHNITVTGFTIQKSPNGCAGIFLAYSTKNNISNNIIRSHDSAIYSVFSNSNLIERNLVTNNYAGIILSSLCKENKVSDNEVTTNEHGILLANEAHSNEITNNNIVQNTCGISISAENNSIFGNQIISNDVGIFENVEPTYGYRIFHNNFINNTLGVSLGNSSINALDNGLEGNYWSDYNGTDFDQEGIGNTPYIINQKNQDKHPLMGMFSDFPFTLEETIYHVTTISNSTISAFQFNQADKMIRFNVTGEDGTLGFCRVCIPKALMKYTPYSVLVDGVEPLMQKELPYSNSTHEYLYFTYIHSTEAREVTIEEGLPPSPFWVQWWFWIIVAVVSVGIVLAAAVYFLRKRKPLRFTARFFPFTSRRLLFFKQV